MSKAVSPFPLPSQLEPALAHVLGYWEGLKRGQADIPFADDVKPDTLDGQAGGLLLFDVFARPLRFRIALAGSDVVRTYGEDLAGRFVDEMPGHSPLDFIHAQCAATAEGRIPTYYRSEGLYARILMPLWADGHIAGLLGAVA